MKSLTYLLPFVGATALTALALPLAALTAVEPAAAASALAQAGLDPSNPDLGALIQQVLQVMTDWKTGGVLVGLIAVSNLGANLLKLKAVQDRLVVKPWALPLASALIAGLGAFGTKLHLAPVVDEHAILNAFGAAVIAALTIGLGGIGLHEAVNLFNPAKQAERAAGALLHDAVVKGDAQALAQVAGQYNQLQAIAAIPADADRVKALQSWAQANPPAAVAPTP